MRSNHKLLILLVLSFLFQQADAADWKFAHENVLGTSCEIHVTTNSKAIAKEVEQFVLKEIDRLSMVFSRYDSKSELMKWQRGSKVKTVSKELATVLRRAEFWRQVTKGAFDVRAGQLIALWRQAEKNGQLPLTKQLTSITSRLKDAPYTIHANRVTRRDTFSISLDALAKGYILDVVCEKTVKQFATVESFTLNIGGDLRKVGVRPLNVSIAAAGNDAENASPLCSITAVGSFAIATSGDYRRQFRIGGKSYSHIIDPRSGKPAKHIRSASVIAPTAIDADAAATALSVLPPKVGLRLLETLPGVDGLLQLSDGRLVATPQWPVNFVALQNKARKPKKSAKPTDGLILEFALNRPRKVRYRRPYVAAWLEDTDGYPVKTALLWIQTKSPGPRWHRDLTRWYRNNRIRLVTEKKKLIGTISAATRGPGKYKAHFDGTDNAGKKLPNGRYTLCLEVAREHGTYQIIRERVVLNGKPIAKKRLKSNIEVKQVSYSYLPPKAKATIKE